MSALTRMKHTLLGSVAAATVLGSIVTPAASAAVLAASSPVPVLQAGGVHPISVRVLSIYMHDDGDGFLMGPGEFSESTSTIKVAGAAGSGSTIHLDNSHGWTMVHEYGELFDRVQSYDSDHNYPMNQSIAGVNKFFGSAAVGNKLQLTFTLAERDDTGWNSFVNTAGAFPEVVVPAPGKETVLNVNVESRVNPHIRATVTVRIATAA